MNVQDRVIYAHLDLIRVQCGVGVLFSVGEVHARIEDNIGWIRQELNQSMAVELGKVTR